MAAIAPVIAQVGPGFSVIGGPPVSFAAAGRQLRAIRAADALESSPEADQEGEGIASTLRDLALRIGREAVQRKLGLHHVSNVATVLSHLSKHHSGVAPEDAEHAAAAADAYRPPLNAEGRDTFLSSAIERRRCFAQLRAALGPSSPSAGARTTTMPRQMATSHLGGCATRPGGSALRRTRSA